MIFIQFKTLFEASKNASLYPKVGIFVKIFTVCLFSVNLKAQKEHCVLLFQIIDGTFEITKRCRKNDDKAKIKYYSSQ